MTVKERFHGTLKTTYQLKGDDEMLIIFKNGDKTAIVKALKGDTPADFSGMDLSGIQIQNADLTGVNFEGAKLAGAKFTNCQFKDVEFSYADMTEANFKSCEFDGNIWDANMTDVEFLYCKFLGVTFCDTTLDYARFYGGSCDAAFDGCRMTGTEFTRAKICVSFDRITTLEDPVNIAPTCTFTDQFNGIEIY